MNHLSIFSRYTKSIIRLPRTNRTRIPTTNQEPNPIQPNKPNNPNPNQNPILNKYRELPKHKKEVPYYNTKS